MDDLLHCTVGIVNGRVTFTYTHMLGKCQSLVQWKSLSKHAWVNLEGHPSCAIQ